MEIVQIIIRKFYKFFWQWDQIQREILGWKLYFEYFFRVSGRKCNQIKARNPKMAKFLKGKLIWKIEKSM